MVVYQGRVFSVEVDRVLLPNGGEQHLAIVRHPPSVVVIPVQADGDVVLIRQYRHAVKRDLWELQKTLLLFAIVSSVVAIVYGLAPCGWPAIAPAPPWRWSG